MNEKSVMHDTGFGLVKRSIMREKICLLRQKLFIAISLVLKNLQTNYLVKN